MCVGVVPLQLRFVVAVMGRSNIRAKVLHAQLTLCPLHKEIKGYTTFCDGFYVWS